MATWQYLQVHVKDLRPDRLTELGSEGWELVAVDDNTAWFKRPA